MTDPKRDRAVYMREYRRKKTQGEDTTEISDFKEWLRFNLSHNKKHLAQYKKMILNQEKKT